MFEVQLINRVAWDNNVRWPDATELGWKDTIRINPLQDTIIALRPITPTLPFDVPNNIRPIDPTKPIRHVLTTAADGFMDPTGQPTDSRKPPSQLRLRIRLALPHTITRRKRHDALNRSRNCPEEHLSTLMPFDKEAQQH